MIRRLNIHETQQYIEYSLHLAISPDYVYHIKMQELLPKKTIF